MKPIIAALGVACFITGCATKPYIHGSITDPVMLKRQMAVDDGECTRQAYSAAAPTQYIDNSRNSSGGFSKGFNNAGGNDIGNAMVRGKIYNGCMLSKGWDKAE